MKQNIFREESLERLSSPEQLDQRIIVTSPRGWLVLIAIMCILISAVGWGFLGRIPAKVGGQGILLNNGGVFSIRHHTSGQVNDVRFKVGDIVKKGDIIARIEVSDLIDEIKSRQRKLTDMASKGLVDTDEYREIENQVDELRGELDYKSQIVSPVDGRVLELNMDKESVIQQGEVLLTLEQYGKTVKLEAVIYVSAEQGEKISPGMEAHISPVSVNKEEYGFILGRVVSVSEYPATTQSMMQTLGNENLVSMLAAQGAPLMIRIDLIADSNTKSGYRWSSPQGPPMSIHGGMLIESDVVISREKPINKVIPVFKGVVRSGEVIR